MKIATFNIQNLFHRDRDFLTLSRGKCITDWVEEFDAILRKNDSSKRERLQELAFLLGFDKTYQNPYAVLRRKAGALYLKGMNYPHELKAGELTNWNGWVKLQTLPIGKEAIHHKARVIADINPDVLILQEVEDRPSVDEFNQTLLPQYDCTPFDEILVIPGSEGKGRELALLLKNGYSVKGLQLHSLTSKFPTQDTLEFKIQTPSGESFSLLSAYFFHSNSLKEESYRVRCRQALQIADRYETLQAAGGLDVLVVGTFHAPSYCSSLQPLLRQTNLLNLCKHDSFYVEADTGIDRSYYRLGGYQKGVNLKQKNYMLLSPSLLQKVRRSGLNRKGVWPKFRPQWSHYASLTTKEQAASSYPAIWGDFRL